MKLTSIQTDQETITIRINRKAFNYATAVAASIVLFFALVSPMANSIKEYGKQQAELFVAPKMIVKQETKTEETQPVVKEEPKAASVAPKDYVIVLASAISEKRALAFAAKLQEQGFNAQACFTGKMIRVIVPGFATEKEAYEMIRQSKAQCKDFAQAWTMHLKDDVKPIE